MKKLRNYQVICSMLIVLLCAKIHSNPPTQPPNTIDWPGLQKGNSVWVWDSTKRLLESSKERSRFYNFCATPPSGAEPIRTIFLYAGWTNYLATFTEPIRDFIKQMHSRRMKVHYLDGTPQWALPSYRELALARIDDILTFNQEGKESERFDGIQFDVEPYLLDVWDDPEVVQSYQEHLIECVQRANKGNLPLGIAIPYFHDERGDDLLEFIFKTVDYVAIMNYKDNAKMMIPNVVNEMQWATKMNVPVWIGVETQPPSKKFGVTPRETFFEEGYEKMEDELKLVKNKFKDQGPIFGFAYHHLQSYRNLSAKPSQDTQKKENTLISCLKLQNEVLIDGEISDWENSTRIELTDQKNVVYSINEKAWQGPNDLSATVFLAWDETSIYIAGKINDDVIVQNFKGADIWKGDHIEIWLDTEQNYDPGRTVYNKFTYQFGISPGNFEEVQPEIFLWQPRNKNQEIKRVDWATKRNSVGYTFELKIPWQFVQVTSTTSNFSIRLNVDPSDTDALGKEQKVLMSTSPSRIFSDPTTFLTVELTE